jgi:hypothetical protein
MLGISRIGSNSISSSTSFGIRIGALLGDSHSLDQYKRVVNPSN